MYWAATFFTSNENWDGEKQSKWRFKDYLKSCYLLQIFITFYNGIESHVCPIALTLESILEWESELVNMLLCMLFTIGVIAEKTEQSW